MTDQYQQNNINHPRSSVSFASTGLAPAQQLTQDTDLVTCTTVTDAVGLTLPNANQIPARRITIKTLDSGTTGNVVTISALPGQLIDNISTFITLTADFDAVTLAASGSSVGFGWIIESRIQGTTSTTIALDIAYNEGETSAAPYKFGTWAEVLSQRALIPVDASGSPMRWRLNWQDDSEALPAAGASDLRNALLYGQDIATQRSSSFSGVSEIDSSGFHTLLNVREVKDIVSVAFGLAVNPTSKLFDNTTDGAIARLSLDNTYLITALNSTTDGPMVEMQGTLVMKDAAVTAESGIMIPDGGTLTIEMQENSTIGSDAIDNRGAAATCIAEIRGENANINLTQTRITGTFDIDIGFNSVTTADTAVGQELGFAGFVPDLSAVAALPDGSILYPLGVDPATASPYAVLPVTIPTLSQTYIMGSIGYVKGLQFMVPVPGGLGATYDLSILHLGTTVATVAGISDAAPVGVFDTTPFRYERGDGIQVMISSSTGLASTFGIYVFLHYV